MCYICDLDKFPLLSKKSELVSIFALLRSGWHIDDYYYGLCFVCRRRVDENVKDILKDREQEKRK